MGRKGGPAEFAEVGDGGVHEVISRPDGSEARRTPNKPTLAFLQKDDVVHKSVADYNEYMRRSVMKGFYKEKEMASAFYQIGSVNNVDNSAVLNEIKEAIKKQKTNVQVINKIDFGYENYRNSNINWRA
jgi:NAD-dependent SIR2 family protein deacetylase